MPRLEVTVDVPLSPADAFAVATAVGEERAAWDPEVSHRRWVRGASRPVDDAVLFTRSPAGVRLLLRYEHVHAGTQFTLRMIKGPASLDAYGEGWRFTPVIAGGTRVTVVETYRLRVPILRRQVGALTVPFRRRALRRRLESFADACARRATAG